MRCPWEHRECEGEMDGEDMSSCYHMCAACGDIDFCTGEPQHAHAPLWDEEIDRRE